MKRGKVFLKSLLFPGMALPLFAFLAACAASIQSTVPNSATIAPFYTFTSPSTQTPTRTPRDTWTPFFSPAPASPRNGTVTQIPYADDFPTPIATPSVGAAAYQLRPWSSTSALNLIDLAEQFSFADYLHTPLGMNSAFYQDDQAAIRVAVQEALHRFPQNVSTGTLEWRIALADAILDHPDSDKWILQQLEDALNSGKATPEALGQLLNLHGFQITLQESASNLFGDNRPAQVLWITLQEAPYTGLYAGLRQDAQGRYSLEKISSTWNYTLGWDGGDDGTIFEIEDHTGDGIPEVVLHPSAHSGSLCSYDLYLFQWKIDRFVDITQGQLHFGIGCGSEGTYDFGAPDARGAQPIETVREDGAGSRVNVYRKYEWNGEVYALTENRLEPPLESDQGSNAWLQAAMYRGDYDRVVQYLSPETLSTIGDAKLGPSYLDYLRFELGLAYAFLLNKGEAQATLTQVANHPANPAAAALPHAARAFLDQYTGMSDLYKACQSALKVMNAAASPPFVNGESVDTYFRKVWGYTGWGGVAADVCSLNMAFQAITSRLDSSNFLQVPSLLELAGVSIRASLEAELNNDGRAEWVVWAQTPGTAGFSSYSSILWVLEKTSTGIKSYEMSSGISASEARSLKARTITTPDGKSVAFIQAGSYLSILQLNTEDGTIDTAGSSQSGVESYSVYEDPSGLMLEVTTTSSDCTHCKKLYRWSSRAGKFSDASYPDESKIAAAEAALLLQWDPASAIPLLQGITGYPDYAVEAARTLYLLGLAYEMKGDSSQAVQLYWRCWSAHPDSIYARLARAKLDLR